MSFKRSLTIAFLILAFLLALLVIAMKRLADAHENTAAAERLQLQSYAFAEHIRHTSDSLTAMVRTYINTGDPKFKIWRQHLLDIRNGKAPRPLEKNFSSWYWSAESVESIPTGPPKSIEQMMGDYQFNQEEKNVLLEAMREYDKVAEFEQSLIEAFEQGRIPPDAVSKAGETPVEWARRQVFSEDYRAQNARIMGHIEHFTSLMQQRTCQSVDLARQTEKSHLLFAWALGVLAVIACIFTYLYLIRHVLQPVGKLVAQSEQLALGNYSKRAVVSGCSELESLASSFNSMASAIETDIARREAAEHALLISKNDVEEAYHQIRSDLLAAAKVQQSLLPEIMPDVPGFSFAYAYQPCEELGGDTLNVLQMDDRHIVFYIVDVSGHGVQAALLASTLSHVLSPIKQSHSILWDYDADKRENYIAPPHVVAERLNQRFPFNPELNQYFTIHYGILNVETLLYRFISAGHPRPVLLSSGEAPKTIQATGAGIGLVPHLVFKETEVQLQAGDRLFFFSDGVLEATNPEGVAFQEAALFASLSKIRNGDLHNGLQLLISEVQRWADHTNLDDISVMALEVSSKNIIGAT